MTEKSSETEALWEPCAVASRDWLQTSIRGITLHDWLQTPEKYRWLMGDDTYRSRIVRMLKDAHHDDCIASGFEFDQQKLHGRRVLKDSHIYIIRSENLTCQATIWCDRQFRNPQIWINGIALTMGEHGNILSDCRYELSYWLENRFLIILHRATEQGELKFSSGNHSIVLYDIQSGTGRIEIPGEDEKWSYPFVRKSGPELQIFSGNDPSFNQQPDRIIPVT